MEFAAVLVVFLFVLITCDVEGTFSVESVIDLVSPSNPQVHRVRRHEDARGDPFAVLDTVGLIEQYGYPAEQHNFTSDDGYNIVIFRMPGSPTSPPAKGKRIIFLQHGMMASSDSWVLMGPKTDLVFMLVDAGYDVWLGNIRGNTYCRTHTNLTTADKEFWDFSWHDMAIMDLSKAISYALEHSGQKKLFYIGHSMGTTMSYILLTQKPEYNEKMRLVISLAPTAFWKHPSNILYEVAVQFSTMIKTVLMDGLGKYDLFPQSINTVVLGQLLFSDSSPVQSLCLTLYDLIVGEGIEPLNISAVPYFSSYAPAGVSAKTIYHFAQCIKSANLQDSYCVLRKSPLLFPIPTTVFHLAFNRNVITGNLQKFDFGRKQNLIVYGTENSPVYNISKISAPIALIYSNTDALSIPPNVIGLSKLFPNLVTCEVIPAPIFNHLDFIISKYAKELLYKRILELLTLYTKD